MVVPERDAVRPHRLIRNPDTGMLAASTMSTDDLGAVFESTDSGSWPMACDTLFVAQIKH